MAKVKIQGHASGTGVLTVTAPNTSTDRTITLPDSTDTLAVNSDVTNKLPLAGGNLTGAVSLTGGDLVIDQTNNGYSGLRIHDDSGGDYNSYIDLGRNQGGTRLSIRRGGRAQGTSPWQNATPDVIVSFANEGIAFHGDTAAANTLDDYEEGTWTPTITCETSGSYSLQGGADLAAYTKIGRVVTVQGGLSVLGESSPNGNLRITLPFTAFTGTDDTDYCMGNAALSNHGSTLDVQSLNAFTYGGAYFYIWGVNADGTSRYIKHTDVDTNWQVYFNFTYIAV